MAKVLSNWEWKDDNDCWTPYHHADNVLIETAFKSGVVEFKTKALSFNAEHQSEYVFDFKKLKQQNMDSKRIRMLRRIESSVDEDEAGFVSALGKAVSFGMHAPPPAPAPIVAVLSVAAMPVVTDSVAGESAPPLKKAKFEFPGFAVALPSEVPVVVAVAPPTAAPIAPPAPVTASEAAGAAVASVLAVDPTVVAAQVALGSQSKRKQKYDLGPVAHDHHGKTCFDSMLHREKQLCGEFAVFYHSYSFAALLYEVQAAVAAVLFRFKSEYATLPRLLKASYNDIPDAAALLKEFPKMATRDHDPRFRAVAISATSSLLASDSEAPPKAVFLSGYSCSDLSFVGVLEDLLVSCGVPVAIKKSLAQTIIELCSKHGLDASQFKGKACTSGRPGHMLQIFVKRSVVDTYVYAAHPFGVFDKSRPVLSKYLEGDGPIQGQVRIVTNPSVFMRGHVVRMYVYSADSTFHANRSMFQQQLTHLLAPIIGNKETRVAAAKGIYGGTLPTWFNPEDHEEKLKAAAAASSTSS